MVRTYIVEGFFENAKDIIVYEGYSKVFDGHDAPFQETYKEFFRDANGAALNLEVRFEQDNDGEENGQVSFNRVNSEGTYRGYVGRYTTDEEKAEDDEGRGDIEILEFTEVYNSWLKSELEFFIDLATNGEFPWLLTYTHDCQIGTDGNGEIYASWEGKSALFLWDETDMDYYDGEGRLDIGTYDLKTLTFDPDADYPNDVDHAHRMRKAMCFCKFLTNAIKAREET